MNPFSNNDYIKELEKQRDSLSDQIQKLRDSKLDDQTKNDKIKELQDQIKEINAQIQEKRSQRLKLKKAASQNASNGSGDSEEDMVPGFTSLVQAENSYSQAKIVHSTKVSLHNQGGTLDTEIKLDEARGRNTTAKKQARKDIQSKETALGENEEAAIKSTQDQVKQASREVVKTEELGRQEDKNALNQAPAINGALPLNLSDMNQELVNTNTKKDAEQQGRIGNFKTIDMRA